jgi:hypothetical protein
MKRALLWLLGGLLATASHAEVDRAAFVRLGGSVLKIEVIRVQGYLRLGQKELARRVLARLESMSTDLAGQLARLIEPG